MSFSKKSEQKTPPEVLDSLNTLMEYAERTNDRGFIEQVYTNLKRRTTFKEKQKLDMAQGIVAYQKVLEEGMTPKQALRHVQETFDLSDEFIEEAKNSPYRGSKTHSKVVSYHNEHPKQKDMVKRNILDKKSLNRADTPNKQLHTLKKSVDIHDTLLDHEMRIEQHEERISQNEMYIGNLKSKVDVLTADIDESKFTSKQELARHFKMLGYNRKQIAKHFGVTDRTISRWLNENKN